MQFSTPTPVRLTVVNPAGKVTVEASERDTTDVLINRKRGNDDEKVDVTHEDRGDHHEITINVPRHRSRARLFGMLTEELDITVQLPSGSSVSMTGATADLTVRGDMGRVEAKSASGDVRVERCTGGKMASVSGDVNVRLAEGECTAQTVSGDVRIGVLRGDLRGRTVSGDLVLECAVEGEMSVGTVSGDVRIGIQRGSRLAVDANSASGDLSSEVDLSDKASPGEGPVVDLRIQTVSGDVRLVRSAEAAPAA